jgi:putative drug exporter of the RND superfamily
MIEGFTARVARWRWVVAAVWIVGLGVAAVVSAPLPQLLSGGGWSVAGSDSALVASELRHGFAGRGASDVTVVVHDRWYDATQPGFDVRVRRALADVRADPGLHAVSRVGYSTSRRSGDLRDRFVGKDGRTAIDVLGLDLDDGTARRVLPEVQSRLAARHADNGLDVSLVGTASYWGEVNHLSEKGLVHAELLTLPLILLVLHRLFGGVVAALTALAVGVTAILFTFAVLAVIAGQHELSLFVQNTATMLGLGVGIDYSLFVIARFKEELAAGRTVDEAIAASLRTSGETVLFSGITILAAMGTLFLVPLGVISSIALGAIVVVAFSVLTSLLLLPVLLRLLGHRIHSGRVRFLPSRRRGAHRLPGAARWQRLANRVMARPLAFLGVGVVALLALAAPAHGLTTFTPDISIVPPSSPVRQGFDRLQDQFGVGTSAPIRVLVDSAEPLSSPGVSQEVAGLATRISTLPSVDRVDSALTVLAAGSPEAPLAAVAPAARSRLPEDVRAVVDHSVATDGRRIVLDVVPTARASDPATRALLREVRREAAAVDAPDLSVRVGGETAEGVASNGVIRDRLPLVVGVMLAVIYGLLLVTFRSVLLPLKAIAMNLLSVGSTFGVLVLVFQHGAGAGLLGLEGASDVQNFVPVLLITLLFSLSTDYEVFLLNRVRELYRRSGDNTGSVAAAMASTAPVISGAALLMVVVFGSFALAGILPIKQLGFGMAVAIAIDATVVRLVLVPATMRLMGTWNWWLPTLGTRPRGTFGQRVSPTPHRRSLGM